MEIQKDMNTQPDFAIDDDLKLALDRKFGKDNQRKRYLEFCKSYVLRGDRVIRTRKDWEWLLERMENGTTTKN